MRIHRHWYSLALAWAAACSSHGPDSATQSSAVTIPPPILSSETPGYTLTGTFSVTADGAATYDVPIEVPPGRGGMQPAVSLSYSSRAGDGPLGVGWTISGLSRIAPCGSNIRHDGERRPVEFRGKDHYCLDGARLVLDGSDYRTEPDSFARITQPSADEWVVYARDGRILHYGKTPDATVIGNELFFTDDTTPSQQPRTFAWLLSRVEDRFGNYMTYSYGRNGLEANLSRIDYTGFSGTCPTGSCQPDRSVVFNYIARSDPRTLFARGPAVPMTRRLASIVTTAPDVPGQTLSWVRKYELGYDTSPATGRARLTKVTPRDPFGVAMGALTLTYTGTAPHFAPAATAPANFFDGAPRVAFAADLDGDGRDDLVYWDSTQHQIAVRLGSATGLVAPLLQTGPPIDDPTAGQLAALFPYDVEGDGRAELQARYEKQVCQACGTPSEHWVTQITYLTFHWQGNAFGPPAGSPEPLTNPAMVSHMGDLDGDLIGEDVFTQTIRNTAFPNFQDDAWHVGAISLQESAAYQALGRCPTGQAVCAALHPHSARFLDVDGDGAGDVLLPYEKVRSGPSGTLHYDLLHVRGANVEVTRTNLEGAFDTANGAFRARDANCSVFADMNGDGLPDLINVQSGVTVQFNTGNGVFTGAVNALDPSSSFTGLPGCIDDSRDAGVRVVDYNQDGRADLLLLGNSDTPETARVLQSTGGTFVVKNVALDDGSLLVNHGPAGDAWTSLTLDANGDGLVDILQVNGNTLELYLQTSDHADLLQQIDDGNGALVRKLTWTPLTQTGYTRGTSCPDPTRCYMGPMMVVTSEAVADPRSPATGKSPITAFTHSYADARVDRKGDGWLGFRRHTVVDVRTGTQHITTYSQAPATIGSIERYPSKGLPVEELSWTQLLTTRKAVRTLTTYTAQGWVAASGATIWFASPSTVEVREYESPSFSPDNPDATPVLRRTITTSPMRDAYGNPVCIPNGNVPSVKVDRDGSGTLTTVTCRLYSNDPTRWLIGLVTSERVTSTTPSGTSVRTTTYSYDATTGALIDTRREPGGGAGFDRCTHIAARDDYGNVLRTEVTPGSCTAIAGTTRTTHVSYDADGTLVASMTNALGQTTTQSVHPGFGLVYAVTDPNQLTTTSQFDGVGRLRSVVMPSGAVQTTHYFLGLVTGPYVTVTGNDGSNTTTYSDWLGHPFRVSKVGFDGNAVSIDTVYDSLARPVGITRPYRFSGTPSYDAVRYMYDALGRVTRTCHAASSTPRGSEPRNQCKLTTYSGLTTDSFDEDNRRTTTVATAFGPIGSTSTYPNGTAVTTSFTYGPFDTLVRVTDAAGNTVTSTYDSLGRRTRVDDRDLGFVATTWDAFDEVVSQTDARQQVTQLSYDLLARLTLRHAPDGDDVFTWDTGTGKGIGRLARKQRGTISTDLSYSALGQLAREHWSVDGAGYDFDYTYDALGRPSQTTYPAATGQPQRYAIRAGYNSYGYQFEVRDVAINQPIWTLQSTDLDGQITAEQFGNHIASTRQYYPASGRIASIDTSAIASTPQHIAYTYSAGDAGDLTRRTIRTSGAPAAVVDKAETFTYDQAHRLLSSQVAGGALDTYSYDDLGNMKQSTDWPPCSYSYGGTAGPHALTSVTCNGTTNTLPYDANGNLLTFYDDNGATTLTYTSFNQPRELNNVYGGMRYTYDADHVRIKKEQYQTNVDPPIYSNYSGNWGTTIEIGGFERRSGPHQPTVDFVHSIQAAGRVVAQRYWRWNGTTGHEEWRYLHRDALGTPERVTDATGAAIEWFETADWGSLRPIALTSGLFPFPATTRIDFTGHRRDWETGLIDMGARFYLPLYHRFLQPDSVVQDVYYGPSWNHYSYAFNNPLRYTDPTGHEAQSVDAAVDAATWAALAQGTTLSNFLGDQGAMLDDKGHIVMRGGGAAVVVVDRLTGGVTIHGLEVAGGHEASSSGLAGLARGLFGAIAGAIVGGIGTISPAESRTHAALQALAATSDGVTLWGSGASDEGATSKNFEIVPSEYGGYTIVLSKYPGELNEFAKFAGKASIPFGMLAIRGHGNSLSLDAVSIAELTEIVTTSGVWREGQPIMLIACSAGAPVFTKLPFFGNVAFNRFIANPAQALADALHTSVYAPVDDIFTSSGKVGSQVNDAEYNVPVVPGMNGTFVPAPASMWQWFRPRTWE